MLVIIILVIIGIIITLAILGYKVETKLDTWIIYSHSLKDQNKTLQQEIKFLEEYFGEAGKKARLVFKKEFQNESSSR